MFLLSVSVRWKEKIQRPAGDATDGSTGGKRKRKKKRNLQGSQTICCNPDVTFGQFPVFPFLVDEFSAFSLYRMTKKNVLALIKESVIAHQTLGRLIGAVAAVSQVDLQCKCRHNGRVSYFHKEKNSIRKRNGC